MDKLQIATRFSALDWGIVGVYIAASVGMGLIVKEYIRDMSDFVVAGRTIRTWLGLATMIATEWGLVTVMYSAQMGFVGGFAAFHIPFIISVMVAAVGITGFVIVPLRETGVLTLPEYYARRYGRRTRILGAVILALSGLLNMGLFLGAGAQFVAGLTGLSDPTHYKIIMSVMLALVLAYTMLGGMVSVILTDYVQFVALSVGALVVTVFALREIGWSNLVMAVEIHRGAAGFNPMGETFGLGYIVFMALTGLGACTTWQPNVARILAAKDASTVRRIFGWGSFGFLVRQILPTFWGICALAFFAMHYPALFSPDRAAPSADMSLRAMPLFFSAILPAGVLGLVMAAMLAAFMSTHDSYLLAWSSVIVQDIVAPLAGDRLSTRARIALTRLCILLIGIFLLIWGLWYPLRQELWNYMALTGTLYFSGALVVITAGLYWRRASSAGAVAAMLSGLLALAGLEPVRRILAHLLGREVRYTGPQVALTATGVALATMVLFSLLLPDRPAASKQEEV